RGVSVQYATPKRLSFWSSQSDVFDSVCPRLHQVSSVLTGSDFKDIPHEYQRARQYMP
ncbi:unnamed protein product, partial [Mycena citricolor]